MLFSVVLENILRNLEWYEVGLNIDRPPPQIGR